MDIMEAVRALGAAIQEDERYKALVEAKKANDADKELQDIIGEFNVASMGIENEIAKGDDKNDDKVKEYNATLRRLYAQIMCNETMINYNKAKADFEAVMRKVNGIIELSIDGEDPMTCEPEEGCTGSCATCGGCH